MSTGSEAIEFVAYGRKKDLTIIKNPKFIQHALVLANTSCPGGNEWLVELNQLTLVICVTVGHLPVNTWSVVSFCDCKVHLGKAAVFFTAHTIKEKPLSQSVELLSDGKPDGCLCRGRYPLPPQQQMSPPDILQCLNSTLLTPVHT